MSNDPLLGLDSPIPEPEKTKWAEVPKKRSGGYAERTRYRSLLVEGEGVIIRNVEAEGDIVAISRQESKPSPFSVPAPFEKLEKQGELPKAYKLKKPSLFQRFLDWLWL